MIKLKEMLIKEEVDKKELKSSIKEAIEAATKLNRALNNILNIFVRHHGDARKAMKDPLFIMVNKIINIRGKIKNFILGKIILISWGKNYD